MRRTNATFAAVAIAASGVIALAAPAQAKPTRSTLHVSTGESIQAAIDAAPPGATIEVAPGTYAENLIIPKDGINLIGNGATLVPSAVPSAIGVGILVADVDVSSPDFPPPINHVVEGVSISGFTIDGQGLQDTGMFVFGADNTTVMNVVARDNFGYGFFANTSTGTSFVNDTASGGGEAGFYIGDSPDANASLSNVESLNNGFGIFVRDAEGVRLTHVNSHDNCIGMLVLADSPGPAGNVDAHDSSFDHNSNACPADEEEGTPPLSGIGVAVVGGNDVRLAGNSISRNVPSGETFVTSGVLIVVGDTGTAPADISIHGNHMTANTTNFVNDGSGVNVKISGNR